MAKYLITHTDLDGKMAGALGAIFQDFFHFDEIKCLNYGFYEAEDIKALIQPENIIYLTDISIPEDVFLEWNNVLAELRIYDHHESASALKKYENCDLDYTRCGTKIFWEDCVRPLISSSYPTEVLEKLDFIVTLTDTYDMWKNTDPLWPLAVKLQRVNVLSQNKAYAERNYFTERLRAFLNIDEPLEFKADETEYADKKQQELDDFLTSAKETLTILTDNEGYKFIALPVPSKITISLVADELFKEYEDIHYLILWNASVKKTFSLRSDNRVDLLGLHGVFGHRSAAGAGAPSSASVKEPIVIEVREKMEKLLAGKYCFAWVKPGEEKSEQPILEEIK